MGKSTISCLFLPIVGPVDQIKHLNRLKHTLAHQFPSYVNIPTSALTLRKVSHSGPRLTSKQIKPNIGRSVSVMYDLKRLIRNISTQYKCAKIGFLEFRWPQRLFLLILDQFKVLETNPKHLIRSKHT